MIDATKKALRAKTHRTRAGHSAKKIPAPVWEQVKCSLFLRSAQDDLREDHERQGEDGEAEVFGCRGEVFADEGERGVWTTGGR